MNVRNKLQQFLISTKSSKSIPQYNSVVSEYIKELPVFPTEPIEELFELQSKEYYFSHLDQICYFLPSYQHKRLLITNTIYSTDNPLSSIYKYYISIITCLILNYTSKLQLYIDLYLKESGSIEWIKSSSDNHNLPVKLQIIKEFLIQFIVGTSTLTLQDYNKIIYIDKHWSGCEFIHIILIATNIVVESIISMGCGINKELVEYDNTNIGFIILLANEIKENSNKRRTNIDQSKFNAGSSIEFTWEEEGYSYLQTYCTESAGIIDDIHKLFFVKSIDEDVISDYFKKDKIDAIYFMINRYYGITYDHYCYPEINKILDVREKQFIYSLLPITQRIFNNDLYSSFKECVNSESNISIVTFLTSEAVRQSLLLTAITGLTLCRNVKDDNDLNNEIVGSYDDGSLDDMKIDS